MDASRMWQNLSSIALSPLDYCVFFLHGFSAFSLNLKMQCRSKFSNTLTQWKCHSCGNAIKFVLNETFSRNKMALNKLNNFSSLFLYSAFPYFLSTKLNENSIPFFCYLLSVNILLKDFVVNTRIASASEITKENSNPDQTDFEIIGIETFGSTDDTNLDKLLGDEEGETSSSCLTVVKGNSSSEIIEPKTKIKFPAMIHEHAHENANANANANDSISLNDILRPYQVLAGVGLRSKSIIKLKSIKIYAFGLYVNCKELKSKLGKKYGGLSFKSIESNENFYNDVLGSDIGMTVRLVVHYNGLTMKMVKSAFETSLKSRFNKYKSPNESENPMHKFFDYFNLPLDVSRGTVFDFCWQPGGKFVTKIGGKKMDTIQSHTLCRAFFDMYIGQPPTCPKAKQEIGKSLLGLLSC